MKSLLNIPANFTEITIEGLLLQPPLQLKTFNVNDLNTTNDQGETRED
jgi:hypothetical protein